MTSKWMTALWIFFYGFAVGALLTAFSYTPNLLKYVFSLLALYLVIRFFRRFEGWPARIAFIVLSILLYFLNAVIVAAVMYIQGYGELAPPA